LFDCRHFNEIYKLENNLLVKKAIKESGKAIISREMNWYRFAGDKHDFIPKVVEYNKDYFVMTKVCSSKPLYKYFWKFSLPKQMKILEQVVDKLKQLHSDTKPVTRGVLLRDMEIEFKSKIENRMQKILPIVQLLENICKIENVSKINEIPLNFKDITIDQMALECFTRLKWRFIQTSNYHLIHGDCQFSNTLYCSETNQVYFVDPRGYFGKSFVYGYKAYDYGKIAYALSGYDQFNDTTNLFSLNIKQGNVKLDVPKDFEKLIEKLSDLSGINKKDLIAMTIVNWLGLAEYFSNNPLKSLGAIFYAKYYHQKYFSDSIY
jgi:hypothetical protein